MTNELDVGAARQAFAGPDKLWISFGTVRPDTPDARSVLFKDQNGQAFPWPTIVVELHPSGNVVPCRVGNDCAGVGEAEWYPFVAGDEVLVAIPQGDERAGCTIIRRMNQTLDVFPLTVAGQDVTTNTFGFKRMRAPYILESATSLLFRQATTNSFISLDKTGNITISEGSANGFMHVGSDYIGMQTGDNSTLVQLDPTNKQILLQADTMQMILDASKMQIMTKGSLLIATSGMTAVTGHAVTAEQVVAILVGLILSIGIQNPGPVIGAALAGGVVNLVQAAIAATITPAASPAPYLGALTGTFAFPADPSGSIAGFGRGGLRF